MKIILVAAVGKNGELGDQGNLPWHIPSDLKHFKNYTLGQTLIMGRKTYESVGKPLPGRKTIVISRSQSIEHPKVETYRSLGEAFEVCRSYGLSQVMVTGGGEVYRQALPVAHELALSRVDYEGQADTTFPFWSENEWELVETQKHEAEGSSPAWTFEKWLRS